MRFATLFFSLIATVFFTANTGWAKDASKDAAKDTITVQKVMPYKKGIVLTKAVRVKCRLPEKLSIFVQKYSKKSADIKVVDGDLKDIEGKVLDIKIINVHGPGGGTYTGAKYVAVEGKLMENGKVISSFIGARYSGGGFYGGFKGTCSILGRCVKAIGKDVAKWLRNPKDGARLGDAPED